MNKALGKCQASDFMDKNHKAEQVRPEKSVDKCLAT